MYLQRCIFIRYLYIAFLQVELDLVSISISFDRVVDPLKFSVFPATWRTSIYSVFFMSNPEGETSSQILFLCTSMTWTRIKPRTSHSLGGCCNHLATQSSPSSLNDSPLAGFLVYIYINIRKFTPCLKSVSYIFPFDGFIFHFSHQAFFPSSCIQLLQKHKCINQIIP